MNIQQITVKIENPVSVLPAPAPNEGHVTHQSVSNVMALVAPITLARESDNGSFLGVTFALICPA